MTAASTARTLYVSDLDGTLLRRDGFISSYTRTVVNALIASGVLFSYATARSFHRAQLATHGLDLTLPVIVYGGAVVVDPRTGADQRNATVPVEAVHALLQETSRSGLQPILMGLHEGRDRVCWIDTPGVSLSPGIRDFLTRRPNDPRLFPVRDWSEIDLSQVFYITVIDTLEPLVLCEAALALKLTGCFVVLVDDVYQPGQYWLDVASTEGTKAAALAAVMTQTGADRLVCFGDSLNDLPMFDLADESYAVANALDEVQARATAVIGSNADDGVATWLARLLIR